MKVTFFISELLMVLGSIAMMAGVSIGSFDLFSIGLIGFFPYLIWRVLLRRGPATPHSFMEWEEK